MYSYHDKLSHNSPSYSVICHIPFKYLIPFHSYHSVPSRHIPLFYSHHTTSQSILSNLSTFHLIGLIPRHHNPFSSIQLHSILSVQSPVTSLYFAPIPLHPNPFNSKPLHFIHSVEMPPHSATSLSIGSSSSTSRYSIFSHPATSLSTRSTYITFCSFTTTPTVSQSILSHLHISFNQ